VRGTNGNYLRGTIIACKKVSIDEVKILWALKNTKIQCPKKELPKYFVL
jgi:hypothetical protein